MKLKERVHLVLKTEGVKLGWFAEKTGVAETKWKSVLHGGVRVNEDHIKGFDLVYPEYTYWLVTGRTNEKCGQISPEIKEYKRLQKTLNRS